MKKIYSLKSCNTCQRILKTLEIPNGYIIQNMKESPISNNDLEHLKTLSGSYEALFSKRAKLYFYQTIRHFQKLEENMLFIGITMNQNIWLMS